MNDFVIVLSPWMQGFLWAVAICTVSAVAAYNCVTELEGGAE